MESSAKNQPRNLPPNFPFFPQEGANDCGLACLKMIASHHGLPFDRVELQPGLQTEMLSLQAIADVARQLGLHPMTHWWTWAELAAIAPWPCLVLLRQSHYVVVYANGPDGVMVADPAAGQRSLSHEQFRSTWEIPGKLEGAAMTFSLIAPNH